MTTFVESASAGGTVIGVPERSGQRGRHS